MTVNSLSPAFVRIFYKSTYAPHIQTIPTREWFPPSSGHPQGTYTAWDSSSVDADAMIQAFATAVKDLYPTTSQWLSYEIFTMDSPTAPQVPRAGTTFTQIGTIATPGYTEANQKTLNFFDTGFNQVKLVFLDADSANDFRKRGSASALTAESAVAEEFTAVTNAWASRAGLQPITFRTITQTLNEKLRREYHQI